MTDFAPPVVVGDVEYRIHTASDMALVIWPWHTLPTKTLFDELSRMGYSVTMETGNLAPYTVTGADTDDSDYLLMGSPDVAAAYAA